MAAAQRVADRSARHSPVSITNLKGSGRAASGFPVINGRTHIAPPSWAIAGTRPADTGFAGLPEIAWANYRCFGKRPKRHFFQAGGRTAFIICELYRERRFLRGCAGRPAGGRG